MQQSMPAGSAPNFVTKPNIRQEKGKIILECQLTADPEPSFSWLLNGKPVTSGGRILTRSSKNNNIYLAAMEISQVQLTDGGQYQCIAKNARGEATATLMLSLEGKKMHIYYRQ